jgi:hypothetical protein
MVRHVNFGNFPRRIVVIIRLFRHTYIILILIVVVVID